MTPGDADTPQPLVGILRCRMCRNTVECRLAELLRYAKTAWPRCCREVMTLFVQAVDDQAGAAPAVG